MAHSAQERPEGANPLLWTVGLLAIMAMLVLWFAHWFNAGAAEGRDEGPMPLPKETAPPVDIRALINDRSQKVIDRGANIFGQMCASCHGPNGDTSTVNARNYHRDAFKNGGSPYQMYLTVTNGFTDKGSMPSFSASLPPADRFAVLHFIRETWVKKDNPQNYVDKDPPEVDAKIPKFDPNASGAAELPPNERPIPPQVYSLMSAMAADNSTARQQADEWIARAAAADEGHHRAAFAKLVDLRGSGALMSLQHAAATGDRNRFTELLANDSSGSFASTFAVMPERDLNDVFATCQRAAGIEPHKKESQ